MPEQGDMSTPLPFKLKINGHGLGKAVTMFWERYFQAFVERMRKSDVPVRIRLWNGEAFDLGESPRVTIALLSPAAMRYLLHPTLDSLGQAYVEQKIDVEGEVMDVVDVAAKLAANAPDTARTPRRRLHMARHSKALDADSISYHYDLSNDFYRLWLDRNMVYSCGYFRDSSDSLDMAQTQKMDHILRKLRLRPDDSLLDIGCGWGALIMRAAEKYGAKALGITLSQQQYELANERIRQAGLADRCEVRLEDYRDVGGRFDRIASVGMFEHVGLKNLGHYFDRVKSLLNDDGIALIHGITSSDADSRETPWGGGDFIDRYVFPNGELPHLSLVLQQMCTNGLEPVDVENLRQHYALTLRQWSERFEKSASRIKEIVDEKSYRIWRVYLAGCAFGFQHNWITVHQILAVNGSGTGNALPLTRNYIYSP